MDWAFGTNFVLQAMNAQGLSMRLTYYHGSTPDASEIQMPLCSGHTAMVSIVSALEGFHCYHKRVRMQMIICYKAQTIGMLHSIANIITLGM